MPVEFLGMIGVKPSESNAAMHIIIDLIERVTPDTTNSIDNPHPADNPIKPAVSRQHGPAALDRVRRNSYGRGACRPVR